MSEKILKKWLQRYGWSTLESYAANFSLRDALTELAYTEARNDKLVDDIDALKAEREWRDIESAPKNKYILVYVPNENSDPSRLICIHLFSDNHMRYSDWKLVGDGSFPLDPLIGLPTHWLPLPAPPVQS